VAIQPLVETYPEGKSLLSLEDGNRGVSNRKFCPLKIFLTIITIMLDNGKALAIDCKLAQ
jgi:hypothetical protein